MTDKRDEIINSWTANASAWTDAVREQRIESRRLATDAAIVDAILEQHPHTVLDVGCGEGWLARALASHGIRATGVDASPELIRAARELGGGEFHAHSYAELAANPALVPGPFEVIAANFALFEEDLHALLVALRGRLAPAGSLVVQTLHPGDGTDGWRVETFASMGGGWREPMPWYLRTRASWERAFAEAGYVVAEVREPEHPSEGRALSLLFRNVHSRPEESAHAV